MCGLACSEGGVAAFAFSIAAFSTQLSRSQFTFFSFDLHRDLLQEAYVEKWRRWWSAGRSLSYAVACSVAGIVADAQSYKASLLMASVPLALQLLLLPLLSCGKKRKGPSSRLEASPFGRGVCCVTFEFRRRTSCRRRSLAELHSTRVQTCDMSKHGFALGSISNLGRRRTAPGQPTLEADQSPRRAFCSSHHRSVSDASCDRQPP